MYTLTYWSQPERRHITVSSGKILQSLGRSAAEQRAAEQIVDLEHNHERYTNQHFDVLSAAWRVVTKLA